MTRPIHTVVRAERVHNRATGLWSESTVYNLSSHDPGSWTMINLARFEQGYREEHPGSSEHGHGTPSMPRIFLEELSPSQPGNYVREIRFFITTN